MSIWDILGIEPTTNARAIKRAYARQLAQHHPEDDPEGFQLVQSAYERALLIARGEAGASDEVACQPAASAPGEAAPATGPASASATERASAPEVAAAPARAPKPAAKATPAARSMPAAKPTFAAEPADRPAPAWPHEDPAPAAEPDYAPEAPRPKTVRGDGVFADAADVVASEHGGPEYIREKMLRDVRHREDALHWVDMFEKDLNAGGAAAEFLRRHPATAYMDVDDAGRAAADLLRPHVNKMRRRELAELERALGPAASQEALRGLFECRRAEYAKRRRDVLSVAAGVAVFTVIMSFRLMRLNHRAEMAEGLGQAREELQNVLEDYEETRDQLDQALTSDDVPEEAKKGLEANAEANRAAILEHLQQTYGDEFALDGDPDFLFGATNKVFAMATDSSGARYGVMAHVDENYLIDEILAATPADEPQDNAGDSAAAASRR